MSTIMLTGRGGVRVVLVRRRRLVVPGAPLPAAVIWLLVRRAGARALRRRVPTRRVVPELIAAVLKQTICQLIYHPKMVIQSG
jgi:hypothetical protein